MIRGFKSRPERPEPDPANRIPCPRCRKAAERLSDEDIEDFGLPSDEMLILLCGSCLIVAAHVPGIQDVWRAVRPDHPEDMDRVIEDGHEGLRQKRWLTDDSNGVMFGPLGGR